MSVNIAITGIKELDNVLKMMPRALDDKFMTQVNTERAKVLVQKMKLTAPEGPTGNLVDSIGTVKKRKAQELGTVWTGPRRKGGYKGFAGHLLEFGTKQRKNRKGANRGVMHKKPFAKPSFDATKGQIEGGIAESVAKVLVRTMRRYLK